MSHLTTIGWIKIPGELIRNIMMIKNFKFTLILLLFSQFAAAGMDCMITAENLSQFETEYQWSFSDKHLICAEPLRLNQLTQSQRYPFEQLIIIRGNILEIKATDFKVLHHHAGYNLALILNAEADQSDPHLNFIELPQFKSIHKFNGAAKQVNSTVLQLVQQVDSARWLADIVSLSAWSRRTGEAGNVSAANWITAQFNSFNLAVSQPSFQVGQTSTKNIMGIQTGTTRVNDWYVVGAHMDAVPTGNAPGAVDNASGCAAVIEMARIASQYSFESTLIFICYSGEEQGLFGSEFHADTLINNGNDNKIKAALTLDMVGYTPDSDHELLLESSATHQGLMNEMAQYAATYAPGLTVQTTTNYFGSDHVSYIDNGMPGVLSIDLNYGMYPGYHSSTDLPENINTTQGEYIIKTNLATLADKATVVGLSDVIFIDGFE